MSATPQLVARAGEVERWTLPGDSLSYPLGANGFVFRRADLESVRAQEHFQDTHVALHLMRAGKREWLRLRGRGVHHYYVQTLTGFIQKPYCLEDLRHTLRAALEGGGDSPAGAETAQDSPPQS